MTGISSPSCIITLYGTSNFSSFTCTPFFPAETDEDALGTGSKVSGHLLSVSETVSHCLMMLWTDLLKAAGGVTKSVGGVVGGTWLQLMCCTLPTHLCP